MQMNSRGPVDTETEGGGAGVGKDLWCALP